MLVSLGVTINLTDYESLRVDVEGCSNTLDALYDLGHALTELRDLNIDPVQKGRIGAMLRKMGLPTSKEVTEDVISGIKPDEGDKRSIPVPGAKRGWSTPPFR